MKLTTVLITLLLLINPLRLLAHGTLHSSLPAAGSVIDQSPANLQLHFSSPARLVKFSLTTEEGKAVKLAVSRIMTSQKEFTLPLPELNEGSYTVQWTIMGGDSHKVSGDFEFTIM